MRCEYLKRPAAIMSYKFRLISSPFWKFPSRCAPNSLSLCWYSLDRRIQIGVAPRKMKFNFMVFSVMKQSIKPKRLFHLFQDSRIWNSIKEVISKRNNIFCLIKEIISKRNNQKMKKKIS